MTDTIEGVEYWAERIAELQAALPAKPPPRFFKPLTSALDGFIREAKATHRIYLGIPEFDEQMRGVSDAHLCLVQGASHSGKSLLMLHMLRSNRDKRVVMYIPDEPATLVLTKLATLTSGIPARDIETAVRNDDEAMLRMLRDVALQEFPNLVVYDKALDGPSMAKAYEEACDHWGAKADFVIYDYLELLPTADDVHGKFEWIKGFGAVNEVPLFVVHQASRSAGAEGRKMTITSGAYGGEQYATFALGVRRKKSALLAELAELTNKHERNPSEALAERIAAVNLDLKVHEYTLTVNLVKNKRPGGALVDDMDFELEVSTGRLFPLRPGDLPKQYLANREPHPAHGVVRYVDDNDEYDQQEMGF